MDHLRRPGSSMDEAYWSAVRSLRLDVADLLETLGPQEWDAPSLCRGWRVRDVAGHLSIVPTITSWQLLAAAPRAGLDPHRTNTLLAVRAGAQPPEQIVRSLRTHAGDRSTAKVLGPRNALFDVAVHSQDIALPLGRELPVAVEHVRRGLERVWEMGWLFSARRRLAGTTLTATDTGWQVGRGPEVTGPALALLLLLTGRTTTALRQLHGPGADVLAARVPG